MVKEAIVLAGGFGTRLAHVVSDVPKPMAPVGGKPFLWHVLRRLNAQGLGSIVLAVGYKYKTIQDYFGDSFAGMRLLYSIEDTPLFTGGAIKKALPLCAEHTVAVLNGDTFFDVDLNAMAARHSETGAVVTVAAKQLYDFERYGTLQCGADGRIAAFEEKRKCKSGLINGGVYLLDRAALDCVARETFSFETDFLEQRVARQRFFAFVADGYFIDIGVPEDYAKAQEDFSAHE